jgi:hypothetical protein
MEKTMATTLKEVLKHVMDTHHDEFYALVDKHGEGWSELDNHVFAKAMSLYIDFDFEMVDAQYEEVLVNSDGQEIGRMK